MTVETLLTPSERTKKRIGRPSDFQALREPLLQALRTTGSITEAAKAIGKTVPVVNEWRRKRREFSKACRKAIGRALKRWRRDYADFHELQRIGPKTSGPTISKAVRRGLLEVKPHPRRPSKLGYSKRDWTALHRPKFRDVKGLLGEAGLVYGRTEIAAERCHVGYSVFMKRAKRAGMKPVHIIGHWKYWRWDQVITLAARIHNERLWREQKYPRVESLDPIMVRGMRYLAVPWFGTRESQDAGWPFTENQVRAWCREKGEGPSVLSRPVKSVKGRLPARTGTVTL